MEKPYLKKLTKIGEFEIWEVDGLFVRNNLNREFTNFGQHFRFPFIPKYQFWLDKENAPGESQFYIDHLLTEWHLMDRGADYDTAIEKADLREERERKKSALMEKVRKENGQPKKFSTTNPKDLHRHRLADTRNLQVWVVNGELVRDVYFIDFTEGGHHFVYDFVPYSEIWLDDDLVTAEREFVLLHELHERNLMFKGMDYFRAHNSSSYIEYQCRKNPKLLSEKINEEMVKNARLVPEVVSALV